MPWVIYDPDDQTYLSEEMHGHGDPDDLSDGLWQKDQTHATAYFSRSEAAAAFAEIDVERILPQIKPIWIERDPPALPRRPWNELTFAEKMEQLEDDVNDTHARRVQRAMMEPPKKLDFSDFQPATVTGRVTSSQPNLQFLPPPQSTASSLAQSKAVHDQLKRMIDNSKRTIAVPKPLVFKPGCVRDERPSFADVILHANYADLEMRVLTQLKKKRDDHGRKEEGFEQLVFRHLYGDDGEARAELPGDEGVPGSGGADRGSGRGEG